MSPPGKDDALSFTGESQKATHHRICRKAQAFRPPNTPGGEGRVKSRLKIVEICLDPNPLNTEMPPPPPTRRNFAFSTGRWFKCFLENPPSPGEKT